MFLILARLFFSEPLHAMPQGPVSAAAKAAQAGAEPRCADHALDDRSQDVDHTGAQHGGVSTRSGGAAHDCCVSDTCTCPAHVSAFVMPSTPFAVTSFARRCSITLSLPPLPHRLTALFRPPA